MKQKTGSILLTSTGLSAQCVYSHVKTVCSSGPQVVSIIVTASKEKKENKYVQLAARQFEALGVKTVHLIDLEFDEAVPSNTTILYVSGGNTFDLMWFARERNFAKTIEAVLDRKGFYVGVSAGAIIVGNSVDGALIEGDANSIDMEDFRGLDFVDYAIFPHADEDMRTKALEAGAFRNPLFIDDQQAFLVEFRDGKILYLHSL